MTRIKFAELAQVSPACVTRLCKGTLKPALVGKRIDPDHPAAVVYLQNRERKLATPAAVAPGIDQIYPQAVEFCKTLKRPSGEAIRKEFRISGRRARAVLKMIRESGALDEPTPAASPPEQPTAERVVSGQEARRTTKKTEALRSIGEGSTVHQVPEEIEKFADMTLRELIERFGSDAAFVDWLKAMKSIEDINEKRLKNATTKGQLVSRQLVKLGILDPIESAHIKLLTDGSKTIARRATAMHDSGRPLEDVEKFVADQITSFIRPIKAKVKRALGGIDANTGHDGGRAELHDHPRAEV